MLQRAVGLASLVLLFALLAAQAPAGGGKDKKFEVPKDAIAGVIKTVDVKKGSFTLTVGKKDHVYTVDKTTEFWGPKGGDRGTGIKGLEDDCMAAGYEIKVVAAKDGKTAKEVFLPTRKGKEK